MDFNPLEIKRMMEQRQRELRGKKLATEEVSSPTKRVRQEKENETGEASSQPVQGFMAKFAVSPKSVRKETALSQASPSTRSRLHDLSKRYAEMEDELPKSPTTSRTPTTPKKRAPAAPTTPTNSKKKAPSPPRPAAASPLKQKKWEIVERTTVTVKHTEERLKTTKTALSENDTSEAKKVSEKAKQFEKEAEKETTKTTFPTKSKVVARGKVAEKISKFDVASSSPRCVIETKPLGSVSSRAKFFEKAMADDKKAADAVYIPVNQRAAKEQEKEEKALQSAKNKFRPVKPVVCDTVLSPPKRSKISAEEEEEEDESEHEQEDDMEVIEEEEEVQEETKVEVQPKAEAEKTPVQNSNTDTTKKVGQVSSKLKNRLEDMIVNGHKTPEDTLMSISEKNDDIAHERLENVAEEDGEEERCESIPDDDFLLSPHLRHRRQRVFEEDTISRITGLPEDGHSTPKPCSSEENLTTPLHKTMSQYRRDEKEAGERDTNVKRIVYQIPSNMMQELRKGKDSSKEEENVDTLQAYKCQIEEEILKQESIMKQTSNALIVCQENGDRGSEQQVEAERLLLIATQRHHVAQSELQRINLQRSVPQSGGTLTICDIKLPYKNEFMKLMRQCNDVLENTHYFIVLVRSGASLIHTELVSTDEKISGGSVNLGHHMVLKNLQEGFRVFVEVYAVQALNRRHPDYETTMKKIRREKEKEANKGGGLLSAFTPKKKNQGTPHGGSSDDGKIRKPSFGLIGRVTLDESLIALDKQVHYLDSYFNESPLDGRILMKIQLNMPPKVTHCGMLRLKDTNGIFGGVDFIKSFFAAIEGRHLNLWNDMREAEEEQEPIRSFDLSQATNTVRVEQSFNFFYFPLKLSNGIEMQFLTYAEDESNVWADKLNACITRLKK